MCQGTSMYNTHMCVPVLANLPSSSGHFTIIRTCAVHLLFLPTAILHFHYIHLNQERAKKTVVFCKPSSTQEHVGSIAYCYNLTNIVKDFIINTTEAFFRILSQSAGSQTLRRPRPRDNSYCTHVN